MMLHELCLSQVNHPAMEALACGAKSLPKISKDLLLKYNLIHLFVISGAHIFFLEQLMNRFHTPKTIQLLTLTFYTFTSNLQAPILRAFLYRLIKTGSKKKGLFLDSKFTHITAALLASPISIARGDSLSLFLSLSFSLFLELTHHLKIRNITVFLLAAPLFTHLLGIPSIYGLFLLPVATAFVGLVLLPLSLISVFYKTVETWTHLIWWRFLEALEFIDIFFNFPTKADSQFENILFLFVFTISFSFLLKIVEVFWNRKTAFLPS